MKHELKTHPGPFQASWIGDKPWEFRRADRLFKERDEVTLREYLPTSDEYTGREIDGVIRYLIVGPSVFGIPDGFCVFTLEVTGTREQ